MAIRVQTYNTGPRRIQMGGIDPGTQRGGIRDVSGTASDNLLKDALAAGKELTGIAIQEYVEDETTRVSQSLLGMQQELNAERDRYMAENKGQDALGAGQHFEQFAKKTARKYLQEGKFSGRFAEMFMKQASGTALHFTEQGQAYGRQQKSAWEESVLQGDIEEFQKVVAQNYNNPELIEFSRDALRQRIAGMRPGMDNRELFSRLDSQTAGSIIEGYLAHDNIRGARGALDKYRDLLGGEVNRIEASIASHARALESRARAEAERARAEAATNMVGQWLVETKGLAPEERAAELYSRLDGISDMKERAQMAGLVTSELAFEKRRDDAKVMGEAYELVQAGKQAGESPLVFRQRVLSSSASEAARKQALEDYNGELKTNELNMRALDDLRTQIDTRQTLGDPMTRDEVYAFAYDRRMTTEQTNKALTYLDDGGNAGQLRQTSVNEAFLTLNPDKKKADVPEWLYEAVRMQLQQEGGGKALTPALIRQYVARAMMQGTLKGGGWFGAWDSGGVRYGKALTEGTAQNWELPVEGDDE